MKVNKKLAKGVIIGIFVILLTALLFLFLEYAYKKSLTDANQPTLDRFIHYAKECGLTDVTASMDSHGKVSIDSDSFKALPIQDKLKKIEFIHEKAEQAISAKEINELEWEVVSGENYYEYDSWSNGTLVQNGKFIYSRGFPSSPKSSKPSSSSTKTKDVCNVCNGTGWARYYVGGSALEAALNGYDDSYVVKCSSCGGTGYKYYGSGN